MGKVDHLLNKIHCADCLEFMKTMPADSIDTIITDPPYGLSFMGKKWDYDVPAVEVWQECLRVLKPGGTMLCFAGSRTQHRMAVNVEDAGFILKDCIMWLYGSGFPKATDISKQLDKMGTNQLGWIEFSKAYKRIVEESNFNHNGIDKALGIKASSCYWARVDNRGGLPPRQHWEKVKELLDIGNGFDDLYEEAEREVIGKQKNAMSGWNTDGSTKFLDRDITLSATPEAQLWNGWKSHGLKPAYEPILVAMKPNDGTYANNALKHGVSGLWIDGGRIGTEDDLNGGGYTPRKQANGWAETKGMNSEGRCAEGGFKQPQGRFPANIILDEAAAAEAGDWCRYFYVAKASKAERNAGCEGMEVKVKDAEYRQPTGNAMVDRIHGCGKKATNHHPTVKPLALMEYLCKLTKTPTGGIVLDPFCGSGTTCKAARNVGRDYIGIERETEYCTIARKRIQDEKDKYGLFKE